MARYSFPDALGTAITRARNDGLWVTCDVKLIGDYQAAVRIIDATGKRMFKPVRRTKTDIELRFWDLGIDYGISAVDIGTTGVRWVQP